MNQEICKTIRERILFMEYPPGKILNENILAKEFDVSRTPLREVLNRLEWEQLVRIIPRTGALVTEIEFQKMMHVFNIRLEIEGLVGSLAAEHVTDDQLGKIDKIRQGCNQLFKTKNQRSLINTDLEFRKVLYEAANNPVLRDISQYLYNLTLRVWYVVSDRGNWVEEVQSYADEIERTYKVLTKRDPQATARLRREVLSSYLERIKSKF